MYSTATIIYNITTKSHQCVFYDPKPTLQNEILVCRVISKYVKYWMHTNNNDHSLVESKRSGYFIFSDLLFVGAYGGYMKNTQEKILFILIS